MSVWMLILIYLVLWDIRSEAREKPERPAPKPKPYAWTEEDEARLQETKRRQKPVIKFKMPCK